MAEMANTDARINELTAQVNKMSLEMANLSGPKPYSNSAQPQPNSERCCLHGQSLTYGKVTPFSQINSSSSSGDSTPNLTPNLTPNHTSNRTPKRTPTSYTPNHPHNRTPTSYTPNHSHNRTPTSRTPKHTYADSLKRPPAKTEKPQLFRTRYKVASLAKFDTPQ